MDKMTDYTIRPARTEDRKQLADLWRALLQEQSELDARFVIAEDAPTRWQNDFSEWVGSSVYGLYVADVEQEGLVGFASVNLWYPVPIYEPELEAYVTELYVATAWRRKGVGTALLHQVRVWAAEKEARRLRLAVLSANEIGLAFWARRGATPFVETLLIDT